MDLQIETTPSEDRRPADWLLAADLPGTGASVASFVPGGFAAYARILHPARVGARDATWADIARWSGRTLRADSDSKELMVRADGTTWESVEGHQGPDPGTSGLDPARRDRLGRLLTDATGTPDRVWALFDVIQYPLPGQGAGYRPSEKRRRARSRRKEERRKLEDMRALETRCGVELAGDRFILHRGRLTDEGPFPAHAPSYWWPEDRAWLVHTNIDCPTTYVAGSRRLLRALLADELLEVVEARLDHLFDGHPV